MHALVIEDEFLIALQLAEWLYDKGFITVDVAVTEDAAVAHAHARRPDIITADYNLLMGTGVGALKRISDHFDVPVVFVTSVPERVRASYPDAVIISKPFNLDDFTRAIEAALA